MIIVDTSVWIDYFRGVNSCEVALLKEGLKNNLRIILTELILTEILNGINKEADYRRVLSYLSTLVVIRPAGLHTYLKSSKIFRTCKKNGYGHIPIVDCLISAMAIEMHASVLSTDKHFKIIAKYFPSLKLL